ncbi:MAG: hypothetical protein HC853_10175 [Anaerolineae bacterium]|nr:hypothetical protein [Anaerolineae bacterium]
MTNVKQPSKRITINGNTLAYKRRNFSRFLASLFVVIVGAAGAIAGLVDASRSTTFKIVMLLLLALVGLIAYTGISDWLNITEFNITDDALTVRRIAVATTQGHSPRPTSAHPTFYVESREFRARGISKTKREVFLVCYATPQSPAGSPQFEVDTAMLRTETYEEAEFIREWLADKLKLRQDKKIYPNVI